MSKKKSGLLIAFGAMLGGAVAAGISYYLKLKSFNDELDQDFHEYEKEDSPSDENEEKVENTPERTYITINSGKDAETADDPAAEKKEDPDTAECSAAEGTCETAADSSSAAEGSAANEKTSSVVVEDDTEEGKTE
mgnify:CR=1 FL=1